MTEICLEFRQMTMGRSVVARCTTAAVHCQGALARGPPICCSDRLPRLPRNRMETCLSIGIRLASGTTDEQLIYWLPKAAVPDLRSGIAWDHSENTDGFRRCSECPVKGIRF